MSSNPLTFSISQQECGEWCWAAVAVAVGVFYQDQHCPRRQCELVNQMLQLSNDCCTQCRCKTDPFDSCNQPQNLAEVLGQYKHCRDDTSGIAEMKFAEVQKEIDDGHPIAVSITMDDPAASGHSIVIYGYTQDGKVHIADPMHTDTNITVAFDDLLAGAGSESHGKWQAAFRTKGCDE
jgi:hypothetical protein